MQSDDTANKQKEKIEVLKMIIMWYCKWINNLMFSLR